MHGVHQQHCKKFSSCSRSLAGEQHSLRATMGMAAEEDLQHQFLAFANFGVHTEPVVDMDGAHFAKYCTDCRLLGKSSDSFGPQGLTLTDVDLVFARVKSKGARRITFDQFLKALGGLAEKQGASIAEIVAHCLRFTDPSNNARAVAQDVRLHDDKACPLQPCSMHPSNQHQLQITCQSHNCVWSCLCTTRPKALHA